LYPYIDVEAASCLDNKGLGIVLKILYGYIDIEGASCLFEIGG